MTALLFQPEHIARSRLRAAGKFADHNFLYQACARDILDRLPLITRSFSSVLQVRDVFGDHLHQLYPQAAHHVLIPFENALLPEDFVGAENAYDLIVSVFDLHIVNDLPGVLAQVRRALRADGVFMAALPGGKTLHQMRDVLLQAEMTVMGGASPRVLPFVDKAQMAHLLQRAGFSLPVVDSEIFTVSYRDIFHVMADLRGMGETNVLAERFRKFTPSRLFFEAARSYAEKFPDEEGRIHADFEIIFIIGWAPHESQQKPAARGSGKVSLTDVL
ncbi:MAG: methyltransferase domain-containing protein [Pseudobdellovibrionaceae bacterium]